MLFFYVRYAVSYRYLEEILEERGVKVVIMPNAVAAVSKYHA